MLHCREALLLLIFDATIDICFGGSPERQREKQRKHEARETCQFHIKNGEEKPHVQPKASADPVSHANTNSCESKAPSTRSSTSASLVHVIAMAGRYPVRRQDSHGRRSPCVLGPQKNCVIASARYAQDRLVIGPELAVLRPYS